MLQSKKQNEMLVYNARLQKRYRQSNNLVESPYSQEFSAHEIKIFEIAASSCSLDDVNFVNIKSDKEFVLSNSELARLLNTKPNVISMEIEKTAARIMKKTIHLRKTLDDGSIEFQMINMIPYAEYKNGLFKFRLNYSLIPYLLEINKNFTEFQLHHILSMSSSYAIKLYKLLYQYKKIGSRKISVEDLKVQFGVLTKYKQYGDFKKYVVESSVKQINIETDLDVVYEEIKIGKKVSVLEFTFSVKQIVPLISELFDGNTKVENQELNEIILSIDEKVSTSTKQLINQYFKDKGILYIKACIEYVDKAKAKNYDKYLADTITKNWAEVNFNRLKLNEKRILLENEKIKKTKEKREADQLKYEQNKQEIENLWSSLTDEEKNKYKNYSDDIIKKHRNDLKLFTDIENILPLCICAMSNEKSYSHNIEAYCAKILKIQLKIQLSMQ